MKIMKEMHAYICSVSNNEAFEIGGILGSAREHIITDVILDMPNESIKCQCKYSPNVKFLNENIEKWLQADKEFLGIFHTHFYNSRDLSIVDRQYIEKIMYDLKNVVEYLYFPVYTLPECRLNVFKAYFAGNKVVITGDDLVVV